MVVIFWFSSQSALPSAADPFLELVFKKGAHVVTYAGLAVCYLWGLHTWRRRWVALLLVAIYAISDEYHQSFTPGRSPAASDVLIDTVGATLGLYLILPRLTEGRARSLGGRHDRADDAPAV